MHRSFAISIGLTTIIAGCSLWPSTSVSVPAEDPPIGNAHYQPGQPSLNPRIERQPGIQSETLAGNGYEGSADGLGRNAQFKEPEGLEVGGDGTVFVAEPYAYRIRKLSPDGRVSTLAGGSLGRSDGQGTSAQFFGPKDLALGPDGSLFVVDFDRIRKLTPDGRVTTLRPRLASGPWEPVELFGIAADRQGAIFVSTPTGIDRIVGDVAERWVGSDAKGFRDDLGTLARFNLPRKLALDTQGNLFVSDFGNLRIRKVSPHRMVTTVVGNGQLGYTDGPATASRLNFALGVAVDAKGNVLISDTHNHAVRKLGPGGQVSTLAGTNAPGYVDGPGSGAQFNLPADVAAAPDGSVYVTDTDNHVIRRLR